MSECEAVRRARASLMEHRCHCPRCGRAPQSAKRSAGYCDTGWALVGLIMGAAAVQRGGDGAVAVPGVQEALW